MFKDKTFLMALSIGFWLNSAFVVAQTLDVGLQDLANQISSGLNEGNKKKIAVVEFSDLDGKITEFGKFLAEELITRLFASKKFEVVERQLLNKVIEEHKLNMSGLIDENTAKQLGKILGVEAICSGTITDLVNFVKVNARIIDTETGSIFAVASAKIEKDDVVKKLIGMVSILPKPSDRIGTSGTVNVAGNLIENGDFKQDLSIGWQKDVSWNPQEINYAGRNWAKLESEGLRIYHDGASSITLSQDIPIISTKLIFSTELSLSARGWAGTLSNARVCLMFLDGNKKYLGEEQIQATTGPGKGSTWKGGLPKDSPIFRHIYLAGVNSGENGITTPWLKFSVDLQDDLETYLIGIKPESIKFVRVVLFCTGVTYTPFADKVTGSAGIQAKFVELKYK